MADKIEIKISPVMDTAQFEKVKNQVKQLQQMAVSSGDKTLKDNVGKISTTADKASKSLASGNIKQYNKDIMELYKSLTSLVSTLGSGSTDLGKKLTKLADTYIKVSQKLEAETKELAKAQAAFKKSPETTVYKNSNIAFTGKGRPGTLVKSEGGLYQTLLANQQKGPQTVAQFASAHNLQTSQEFNTKTIQEQAAEVAALFTEKLTKEFENNLKQQQTALNKTNEELDKNIKKQYEYAEALKQSNPQDTNALNAFQQTLPGVENFSAGKAGEASGKGAAEGIVQATKDIKSAQDQLSVSNEKVTGSFRKSILGVTAYGLAIRQLRR